MLLKLNLKHSEMYAFFSLVNCDYKIKITDCSALHQKVHFKAGF